MTVPLPYEFQIGMRTIILLMEPFRKRNMFSLKTDWIYFKTRFDFHFRNWFWNGFKCIYYFLETLNKEKVNYVGVEAYPISTEEIAQMNYVTELQATQYQVVFDKMHSCDWESKKITIILFLPSENSFSRY